MKHQQNFQKMTYSTARNLIKEAGYSRKKATKNKSEINSERRVKIRFERAFFLAKFLFAQKKFIYIDESSFNNNMEGNYAYSKSGKNLLFKRSKDHKT